MGDLTPKALDVLEIARTCPSADAADMVAANV
jgi:hypothetical protein